MSPSRSHRILRASLPLSIALGLVGACSFPWEDYRPTTGAGGSTSSSSSGGGGCGGGEKVCGGACVSIDDPLFGCAPSGCTPCSLMNATAKCVAGACAFDTCNTGFSDCDGTPGCELPTDADPLHCGGCTNACTIANGTAGCAAGACTVASCNAGFADCTGGAADGCETDTNTSLVHCGACNSPCPTTCAGGTCLKEDCANGVDDDGDGLADCADPDCTSVTTCVDTAPFGWSGPVYLYDGPTAAAPTCATAGGAATAYQGYSGLSLDPPTCSACTCTPAITCTPAPINTYTDFTCTTFKASVAQPAAPACATASSQMVKAYQAAPPSATIGACTPSGGTSTSPPPSWASTGLTCVPAKTGAGCAAAQVCVPSAGAPFAAGACIYQPGDQVCPASFPTKHSFKDGAVDSRTCSACACTGAGTGTCSVTTQLFASTNCTGAVAATVPNDGACHKLTGGPSLDALVTTSGSCPASGGTPSGQITESAAVTTVCCTP